MSFPLLEKSIFEARLRALSPDASEKFQIYLDLLLKWNAKLNLTAVRDSEAILHRHFIECVQCAQELPAEISGRELLDFGSGAGLPGIPIAICRPDIRVTLAESQRKKAAFLSEAIRSLSLAAKVYDGRVEDMAQERKFQAITLRAVDKMPDACSLALNRLAPGGWLILFATHETEPQLKATLPDVIWKRELPTPALDHGTLLLGQLSS